MYMYVEATTDEEMVQTMATPADQISTILGRFCCAFIAHITLTSESKQGLSMMKYASNHHWKFKQWWTAYFVGFFQFSVLIACEYVNLIILTVNHSMLDILMNFMAIIVITEFDDHFFLIIQSEALAKLVTDGECQV